MSNFFKSHWLLLTILISAFGLRIWGINYGLPYFYNGDEPSVVYGTFKMVELKTLLPVLHPQEFDPMYYPPLMAYLYLIILAPILGIQYLVGNFQNFSQFKDYLILNPTVVWLAVRTISVIFGTATVFLVYLIGKKLFSKKIGLWSALFLSTSFLHLQLSHFAKHWVPAAFGVALIAWLSVLIYFEPKKKYYYWLGLAAGLMFGITYVTAIGLVVFLLAHFLRKQRSWQEKFKDKNFRKALIIFAVVAGIFVALHPQELYKLSVGPDSTIAAGKSLAGLVGEYSYHAKNLLNLDPVILFFSCLGFVLLLIRDRIKLAMLASLPVFYIMVLYFASHSEVRYSVFVMPFLAIIAGFSLDFLLIKLHSKLLIAVYVFFLFCYPLSVGIYYNFLLTQTDTRISAINWIKNNLPAESRIATDFTDFKLTPTKEAISVQENLDPGSLRIEERLLAKLAIEDYPRPAFNDLRLHFIGKKLPNDLSEYLKINDYKYFALDFWQPGEITAGNQAIIKDAKLLIEFSNPLADNIYLDNINGNFYQPLSWIFSVKRLGPAVGIYKISE